MDGREAAFESHGGRPDAGPFPTMPRVSLVVIGGLLALWASATAASLHAQGFEFTGLALPVAALPFALFLFLAGLVPAPMQRLLSRKTRVDLRDGGHVFALIVLTLALFVVFGLGSIVDGLFAYESLVLGRGGEGGVPTDITEGDILQGLLVNLVLFTAPPILWLTFVNDATLRGAFERLGFKSAGAGRAAGLGAAFAIGTIIAIGVVTALLVQAGVNVPENEQAVRVAEGVSIGGAFAVAALSSVGEEVFFRGFIYPRVGMIPQAILFAIAHLSYVNVLQIVVTFALALGFAWLYKKTGSLWAPVSAHFTFNLVMLLLPRLARMAEGV